MQLKELAEMLPLEVDVVWTRPVLWMNILVLTASVLTSIRAEICEDVRAAKYALILAVERPSHVFTVFLAVLCAYSWTRLIGEGVVKNVLTLPVSRPTLFLAKTLGISVIPLLTMYALYLAAGPYLLGLLTFYDVAVLLPLFLLHSFLVTSAATLASLLVRESIVATFMSVILFTGLDYARYVQSGLKYLSVSYYYRTVLTGLLFGGAAGDAFSEAVKCLGAFLALSAALFLSSYMYFGRMDLD